MIEIASRDLQTGFTTGDVDHMCQQLLERREALGVSYITAGDMFMDALAPVIEQLAGR